MAKSPKGERDLEGDPKHGDAILKRMLQTKPKPHKDVVAERKDKRAIRRTGKKSMTDDALATIKVRPPVGPAAHFVAASCSTSALN